MTMQMFCQHPAVCVASPQCPATYHSPDTAVNDAHKHAAHGPRSPQGPPPQLPKPSES